MSHYSPCRQYKAEFGTRKGWPCPPQCRQVEEASWINSWRVQNWIVLDHFVKLAATSSTKKASIGGRQRFVALCSTSSFLRNLRCRSTSICAQVSSLPQGIQVISPQSPGYGTHLGGPSSQLSMGQGETLVVVCCWECGFHHVNRWCSSMWSDTASTCRQNLSTFYIYYSHYDSLDVRDDPQKIVEQWRHYQKKHQANHFSEAKATWELLTIIATSTIISHRWVKRQHQWASHSNPWNKSRKHTYRIRCGKQCGRDFSHSKFVCGNVNPPGWRHRLVP